MTDALIKDVTSTVRRVFYLPLASDLAPEHREALGLAGGTLSETPPTSGDVLAAMLSKHASGDGPDGDRFSFVTELPGAMMEFRDKTGSHCLMFGDMDRLSEEIGFCRLRIVGTPLIRKISEILPVNSIDKGNTPAPEHRDPGIPPGNEGP